MEEISSFTGKTHQAIFLKKLLVEENANLIPVQHPLTALNYRFSVNYDEGEGI